MKVRKKEGFVAIDMAVAVMAVILFSTLILSLIYYNALENAKIKKDALAIVYLTEIMENVGVADYTDVTQDNANQFIPSDLTTNQYRAEVTITTNNLNLSSTQNEDIIKKVSATVYYKLLNKEYQYTMERIKIKE